MQVQDREHETVKDSDSGYPMHWSLRETETERERQRQREERTGTLIDCVGTMVQPTTQKGIRKHYGPE